MNLIRAMLIGGILAMGIAAPAAAQVVDFGDGIRWDTAGLQKATAATVAQLGHEYDQRMHASQ